MTDSPAAQLMESPAPSAATYYFAYGANMSRRVFHAQRGMRAASAEAARLDGYRLVFDLPGVPVVEPAFASVVASAGHAVHGVLYRMEAPDIERILATESPRYRFVDLGVLGVTSGQVIARVLQNRTPVAGIIPSRRYLRMMCTAARDAGLPEDYVLTLEAHPCAYVPVASELAAGMWAVFLGYVKWKTGRRQRAGASSIG
jgi:hypothetical protein